MFKLFEGEYVKEALDSFLAGRKLSFSDKNVSLVSKIINKVSTGGDSALIEYTKLFDKVELCEQELKIPEEAIKEAVHKAGKDFMDALKLAHANITDFHKRQKEDEWFYARPSNVTLGMRSMPIEKAGLYVPGGRAAYPSTVLMNAIPARIAGVEEIVMVSPPPISPYILAAASLCGIKKVYQVGGAQAIAALAFGTRVIPQVDKIVGPGNIYVTLAKKLVYGQVDIDSLAGPSDILIIADIKAKPGFAAADLLAQLEHDTESSAILVTTSEAWAQKVIDALNDQVQYLSRKEIITQAAYRGGIIYVVNDLEAAAEISNQIAPEHLELMVENPQKLLPSIKNAGAIFLGQYSPVALGDYVAGTNHVLPTAGTARFSSPLGVYDFMKKQSVLNYSKTGLSKVAKQIETLAMVEGLDAHAKSVNIRS